MDTKQAIQLMCRISGKSLSKVSTDIDRSRNFLATTLSKNSRPQVDTMAKIAHVCGFKLVLISNDGDTIELYQDL